MARLLNLQILVAAAVVLLGVWAVSQRTWWGTAAALVTGISLGAASGRRTAVTLRDQFTKSRRIVLYSEDTPLYATLLPLASLTFSPGVFLLMLYSAWINPSLQTLIPMVFCTVTTAWLTHELMVARLLARLASDGPPVTIHLFHARSVLGPEGMIGQRAVVVTDCRPEGYVRVNGERWRARSLDGRSLVVGQPVVIEDLDGLVLVVAAAPPAPGANIGGDR